jgi:protein gp37
MGENSAISWTHNTFNPWLGCDKVAPECAKCYISRILGKDGKHEPFGDVWRSKTWGEPDKWERKAAAECTCKRVFTCSLADFFHIKADPWRPEAWELIRRTEHMVYLILTKRAERIEKCLPPDWPYPNAWLGVSSGCGQTLNKMDALRRIPMHEKAVRILSAEPLLEDITQCFGFSLDGFGWVITGGESGYGDEYQWNRDLDWRKEFNTNGRRTMKVEWAENLRDRSRAAGIPFFFKQITATKPGFGESALGQVYHEFPEPPMLRWA